jgi:hypothetical protein
MSTFNFHLIFSETGNNALWAVNGEVRSVGMMYGRRISGHLDGNVASWLRAE